MVNDNSTFDSDPDIEELLEQIDPYIVAQVRKVGFCTYCMHPELLDIEEAELVRKVRISLWPALKKCGPVMPRGTSWCISQGKNIRNIKDYIKRIVHNELANFLRGSKSSFPLPVTGGGEMREGNLLVTLGKGMADLSLASVGDYVLIDPDIVSRENPAAALQIYRDIGQLEADCIADRVRDVSAAKAGEVLKNGLEALENLGNRQSEESVNEVQIRIVAVIDGTGSGIISDIALQVRQMLDKRRCVRRFMLLPGLFNAIQGVYGYRERCNGNSTVSLLDKVQFRKLGLLIQLNKIIQELFSCHLNKARRATIPFCSVWEAGKYSYKAPLGSFKPSLPPCYDNPLWYWAEVVSGYGQASGWLNDHFLNTGTNQPDISVAGVHAWVRRKKVAHRVNRRDRSRNCYYHGLDGLHPRACPWGGVGATQSFSQMVSRTQSERGSPSGMLSTA